MVFQKKRALALGLAGAWIAAFPFIFRDSYVVSILIMVGIFAILAFSVDLILSYAGQMALGHQGFFGLGAYVSGVLSTRYGLPPLVGLLSAILLTYLVAYVIGWPALRLKGYYFAIATLAFGLVIQKMFVTLRTFTGGNDGLRGIPPFSIGPLVFDTDFKYYYLVWVLVFASLLVFLNIVNSRVGLALRAIKGDEDSAAAMGIDLPRYKMMAFLLTAGFAGLAGVLYAHYMRFIAPISFSLDVGFMAILAVFLGGRKQFGEA